MGDEIQTLELDITSLREYPRYNRPTLVGCFSLDSSRNYHNDLSQMNYIYVANRFLHGETLNVRYDLNKGREKVILRDDKIEDQLNNLLKWILENKDKERADMVSFRGLLTLLMCTPYEKQEGWIVCATKLKGTMFFCEFETDQKKARKQNQTEKEKRFLYWGRQFEKYMCSDKPQEKPDPSTTVNENEEWCVIMKTKFQNRVLMFGAETDGVLNCSTEITGIDELAKCRLLELKTNRRIDYPQQEKNFKRFKQLKWWCQCYLVGIENIICGFRDDKGIVHTLKHFDVLKIPREVGGEWRPNVCFDFCDKFLQFAERLVQPEHPDTVWKFEWSPGEPVTAVKIPGPSQYSFLPAWFIEGYSS